MGSADKHPVRNPSTEQHGVDDEASHAAPDAPVTTPAPPEPDWYVKIQRAKEAREAGIKLRKNKPSAVITQLSPV